MPYVVIDGKVKHNGVVYGTEETVPAMKNALANLAAEGIVEWRDSRTHATEQQAGVYAGLTKKELLALCEARELEIPKRAKVGDLVALLEAADAESAEESDSDEGEQTDAGESSEGDADPSEDETADESEDSQD